MQARVLGLGLAATILGIVDVAFAQSSPGAPSDCPPDPACPVAPPTGEPPPITPQLEAQTRATFEAEARRNLEASVAREVEAERRSAWLARTRIPPAFTVDLPALEWFAEGRLATFAQRDYAHVGGAGGARLRVNEMLGFELAGGGLLTYFDGSRFAGVTIEPSMVLGFGRGPSQAYLRVGLSHLLPIDRPSAPDVIFGVFAGIGAVIAPIPLGDGGYAGLGFDVRGVVRGGFGGEESALKTVRTGGEVMIGPRVAFF